ncbi:prepilin peptidase [Candidatus Pacearchaeota archaeon]|nr:prepilin peptidase [Candidatus Pacearchaeota archaeon]
MIEFLIILALVWLVFAVIQDFKHREIANWLNFSLPVFALAIRAFYSVFNGDPKYILFGIIGLAIGFILANAFYYARMFAGGDAKLLIALGAVIPFAATWRENALIGIIFLFSLLFIGGIYSLIYSGFLAGNNKDKFKKEFKIQFKENKKYFYLALIVAIFIVLAAFYFNEWLFIIFAFLLFVFPWLYIYTKAVEQSSMLKLVGVKELTIGDWLSEEIVVKGKKISPYWEGLNEDQLQLIQKNYKKKVLVKQGIPFSLSFLLAFLVLIYVKYAMNGDWNLLGLF